ncbi:16S rRNA (cytidine(1402)-2'-O)-methyltransferase [Odoribacter laneus]|uniref:Ribosomal RNA small subunit methyltransferase I n=2 Tax=Odoribacter laneus TaxID=626933 RepID=H1DK60_9BACT|nr:16S rRNA (cytidine(1402)-2'-O)-methyltransferase [Odoribacter laneus]EHP45674.1 YraL family putative S-adenosylmethionine-dependent methyltransferase [Odoribacter laneus YIT 12061]
MGKLYLIPTPVGNLEDITLRALRLLKEVSLILAEDTRTTSNLLKHYDIKTPLQSHHKFNEHQQVEKIAERLAQGEDIALVSDAGTPGISDPGFLLTKTCIEHGIETECLPGATAFVPALVNSGFPCDRFCFEGFLPQKKGRLKRLTSLSEESRTLIFYESPYRLVKALQQMSEIFGPDRQACVAREISKVFEEFKRGNLQELADYYTEKGVKGEIVLIVEGKKKEEEGGVYIEMM